MIGECTLFDKATSQRKVWHPLAGGGGGAKLTMSFNPITLNEWDSPLIINNLHTKFESDLAKTVTCIVSTTFHRQSSTTHYYIPSNAVARG